MHSKVFSSLLGQRIQAAQKFPQIRLKAQEHIQLSHHRQCCLSLSSFHEDAIDFCSRELHAGQVVEVRKDDNRLLALGFFEPQLNRVDVFDLTPKSVSLLPTVSEDFFIARVHEAWEKRRRLLHQSQNNTYRIVNGSVDGLPSLFVDTFSDSFVRVIATSSGAERLVPAVAEYLRRRGVEEILLDTPTLGSTERLTMINPTIPMSPMYIEGGIRHLWLKNNVRLSTLENRLLLNPAHRRARRMIRDLGRDKKVLCVHDRSGSATMNAVLTAQHVTTVDEDANTLEWVRENLVANHTPSVFKSCRALHCSLDNLDLPDQQDIVYLEHHPDTLSSKDQWNHLLVSLIRKKIIGPGTIVVMAQEAAPLGIQDLLSRRQPGAGKPASRKWIAQTLRDAADACELRVRFLRAFAPSCDYPLLPEEQSICFSLAYLIEGPAIR